MNDIKVFVIGMIIWWIMGVVVYSSRPTVIQPNGVADVKITTMEIIK